MAKTQEELNIINEEVETLNRKPKELTVDEFDDDKLKDISGGTRTNLYCKRCGRPHSVNRTVGLCRICYYEMYKKKDM